MHMANNHIYLVKVVFNDVHDRKEMLLPLLLCIYVYEKRETSKTKQKNIKIINGGKYVQILCSTQKMMMKESVLLYF